MNARLDLWLYVSLLAASLALDILLLPALLWTPGVISQVVRHWSGATVTLLWVVQSSLILTRCPVPLSRLAS